MFGVKAAPFFLWLLAMNLIAGCSTEGGTDQSKGVLEKKVDNPAPPKDDLHTVAAKIAAAKANLETLATSLNTFSLD